jgi:flagellar biosynthetic protein FlhB
MADEFQEKTEEATPKRREDARLEGQVARSMELNSAAVLMAASLVFFLGGRKLLEGLGGLVREAMIQAPRQSLEVVDAIRLVDDSAMAVVRLSLPFLATVLALGLMASVAQVGFQFSAKPLMPKLDKLNPIKGIQQMFSARSAVELAKSIAKVSLMGWLCWLLLQAELTGLLPLVYATPGAILGHVGGIVLKLLAAALALQLALGAADLLFQRWDTARKLRMSVQEIKEERRQTEGDPLVKSRLRSLQHEAAYNTMLKEVVKADVVVTNPTHLAVAIKYDPDHMNAPTVVAKGARLVAQRIRELAREHGVPVVENKPMARTLFKACEVGMEIPGELYRAVAELLAFVYRLGGRAKG